MTVYIFSVTSNGSTYYDHVITGDQGWINSQQAQRVCESRQPAGAQVYYQGTR